MFAKYDYSPLPNFVDGKLYPMVPIKINDVFENPAYVDTGASMVTLSFSVVQFLKHHNVSLPNLGTSQVTTTGGSVSYMVTKLPSFEILGLGSWKDVNALASVSKDQTAPFMVVGNEILDEFWVTFCGKNKELRFEK